VGRGARPDLKGSLAFAMCMNLQIAEPDPMARRRFEPFQGERCGKRRRLSGAREFQQRRRIMIVSRAKGRDVTSAQFTDIGKSSAAPTETLAAKTFDLEDRPPNERDGHFRLTSGSCSYPSNIHRSLLH